jgi:peptidoglycan pentaglycine glycine transferase (the first glycine)
MKKASGESDYRASIFKSEESPTAWHQALARLPHAHALQSWAWGEFKSRWGWRPLRLLMAIGGNSWEAQAAAQVLQRKIPRMPYSILYVPKGPALDYHDVPLRRQVLSQLETLARRERAIFIKIDPEVVRSWGLDAERVSPLGTAVMRDLRERRWRPSDEQIQFRNTVEIPLDATEDQLLAGMKQKTRYNIRLAERKGVMVRPGTADDFPVIAGMYAETAARDGFAVRPAAYYLDGWKTLYEAGLAHPLLADVDGRPVAAIILIRFGERAIYMYGASSNEARERMPNYLLQWEAIRWAKNQGCTVYDLWGAPDEFNETDRMWGVWRFKAGLNGEVVRFIGAWDFVARPLFYYVYSQMIPRYLDFIRRRRGADDRPPIPG